MTSGTLTTEPDVFPPVKAHLIAGWDWMHADPSGDRLQLDAKVVLKYSTPCFVSFPRPLPPPKKKEGEKTQDRS